MSYVYSRPYIYSFWQILQALRLFPALRLFQTLEYAKKNKALDQLFFKYCPVLKLYTKNEWLNFNDYKIMKDWNLRNVW